VLKSTDSKRSKPRSSSSSHRGYSAPSCLSSAFTFDGIGAGDFQLDSVGADPSEINDLLETLQSHDGAALMSDFSDSGCLPFDSLESFNFGFSTGGSGMGPETVRQPNIADNILCSQNNDGATNFDSASCHPGNFNGE